MGRLEDPSTPNSASLKLKSRNEMVWEYLDNIIQMATHANEADKAFTESGMQGIEHLVAKSPRASELHARSLSRQAQVDEMIKAIRERDIPTLLRLAFDTATFGWTDLLRQTISYLDWEEINQTIIDWELLEQVNETFSRIKDTLFHAKSDDQFIKGIRIRQLRTAAETKNTSLVIAMYNALKEAGDEIADRLQAVIQTKPALEPSL